MVVTRRPPTTTSRLRPAPRLAAGEGDARHRAAGDLVERSANGDWGPHHVAHHAHRSVAPPWLAARGRRTNARRPTAQGTHQRMVARAPGTHQRMVARAPGTHQRMVARAPGA